MMLSKTAVFGHAAAAKNRLIILNHVGVLSTNRKDLPSVVRLLNSLSGQEDFNVVLISPCSRRELDESIGKECPKLILVAENGVFFKIPAVNGQSGGMWEDLIHSEDKDISWHEAVIGIM